MRVDTLVCATGMETFVHPKGEYPCDSRWVSHADAAGLLGYSRDRLRLMIASGSVPINFQRKVSLDWIDKLLELKAWRQAANGVARHDQLG